MKTAQAIKGRESEVYKHFGVTETGNRHIDCIFCDEKKSMRVTSRGWICKCGNGSPMQYIMQVTGRDFPAIAREIDDILGNNSHPQEGFRSVDKVSSVINKWRSLKRLQDTPAQLYLNTRDIYHLPLRALKYGKAYDYPTSSIHPAMIGVATDDDSNPCYIHKTYLADDGKKADLERVKKIETIQEAYSSVAIRLYEVATCLGIAEGIETALSCKRLYDVNTWATMNTSFMKKFKAPQGVKHLMIFADADSNGAGHAAAFECAHKNMIAKSDVERVTVRWCERGDFNDLLRKTEQVYEWELRK